MSLEKYLKNLKLSKVFPKTIQNSKWHDWYIVSCFDESPTACISEGVFMGIDKDPEVAMLKCLTEYCERTLSKESVDPVSFLTKRSDGFAAFPIFDSDFISAKLEARKNALNEATERYLWSTWWDQATTAFQMYDALELEFEFNLNFRSMIAEFELETIQEIQIDDASRTQRLSIFLAKTQFGGFITGGACSPASEPMKRFVPAFGELLRHLLAFRKMQKTEKSKFTFYEKRLWGFASGEWHNLVEKKLQSNAKDLISLPKLFVDTPIVHSHPDLVVIHRCLYENQPIFMGGDLARLCI